MTALMLLLVCPVHAQEPDAKQAEERVKLGDLASAESLARWCVARQPGPESFRARQVLFEVALRRGALPEARVVLLEVWALPVLSETQWAWIERAEGRLRSAKAEGAGEVEEAEPLPYCQDADGDGYGDSKSTVEDCLDQDGYVSEDEWSGADCDDQNASVFAGAPSPDLYDGIDQDCDGAEGEDAEPRLACTSGSSSPSSNPLPLYLLLLVALLRRTRSIKAFIAL